MEVIKHLEKYLGTITEGESVANENYGKLIFLKFANRPFENITTYVSLGLSNHILHIKEGKEVRMEILASIYTEQESNCINDLLLYVSNKMLKTHKAILRGQVLEIPENILGNNLFTSVYVSIPIFFEEGFATIKTSNPDTIFAWIFPLYKSEADFISRKGWDAFEDLLEKNDCDFWSLGRPQIDFPTK